MSTNQRSLIEGILFTDEYQLTMAQLYFRMGLHEKRAQFDHFFRSYPNYGQHKAGFCINAGLEWLLDWMEEVRFSEQDLDYLKEQKGQRGTPLFQADFLKWLAQNGSFDSISMQAIPEGRVVHPDTPLTVVQGPLAIAQLLETRLLNMLNYQTLIATKAARVRESCRGSLMMEFGARRAHDKGANAGVRGALIGGADYSSNVGISHALGFAPKGTHAHSMVQAFMALNGTELDAFRAYAEVYPDDCILLVDTIDTLKSGVPNAIRVFEELRRKGHEPLGIRLDSGDLAYLSIQAAKMLNAAGFENCSIVLSNNLDELVIWQIHTQIIDEAPRYQVEPQALLKRLAYGVGTRLITSDGQPALGGVYKLVAIEDQGQWIPAMKISETPAKTLNPGDKRAWRIYDQRGNASADLLGLNGEEPETWPEVELRHPREHTRFRRLRKEQISRIEALQIDVLEQGRRLYDRVPMEEIRAQRQTDLERLDPGVRRLINPHIYHVSLTKELWNLKQTLIQNATKERRSQPNLDHD